MLQTFNKPNVHLVTDPIAALTEKGINTTAGGGGGEDEIIPLDVIIYATGFDLQKSFRTVRTVGADGLVMEEEWGTLPKAMLGTTYVIMT